MRKSSIEEGKRWLPDGIPAEVFTREAALAAVALAKDAVEYVGILLASNNQG